MRTLSTLLVLALGLTVVPQLRGADESKAARGERAKERIAESMADLNLTNEQETKIADIQKQNQSKIRDAAKQLSAVVKEEIEKIQAVLTPEQKAHRATQKEERKEERAERLAERIARVKELDLTDAELAQFEEIKEETRPKIEKLMTDLAAILTPEQKEARSKALQSGESRREVREALNLSAEQKQKVDAIGTELVSVVRQELEKMHSVLTPAQQAAVAAAKEERKDQIRDRLAYRIETASKLKLTADQKASISKIRKEYRPKVQDAGDKLRAAVREEVAMILAVFKK